MELKSDPTFKMNFWMNWNTNSRIDSPMINRMHHDRGADPLQHDDNSGAFAMINEVFMQIEADLHVDLL